MDSSDQHAHTEQQQEEKIKEYEPMIFELCSYFSTCSLCGVTETQ